MSSATPNAIYAVVDGVTIKLSDHACWCDECKRLDPQDAITADLCKSYLHEGLTRQDLQVGLIEQEHNGRFPRSLFDEHPSSLADYVEDLFVMDAFEHEGQTKIPPEQWEARFRLRLEGLILGYECRKRTERIWRRKT